MEREILAYIKQNRMIGKNDVVLAGVSGGSDSMAMLRILKELQGKLDFTLRVVHIHHGIRGKEADRDQSFVENICRKWLSPCIKKQTEKYQDSISDFSGTYIICCQY